MVKVSAGAAANQFKRVGNYIAPQVNKGADRVAANARQQKQINATRENQEDQQLEKRLSDTKVEDDDFLIDATGITDEDDFNRLAAKNGISKAKEIFKQARELDFSGDRLGADNLRAKAGKIQSSFKNLVNNIPLLKEKMAGFEKEFTQGKIKPEAYKRMAIGGAIRGEVVPELNDNGDWELKVLVRNEETGEVEKDKDGKAKYVRHSIGDIKKGLSKPYYFNEMLGKGGELNKVLVAMGKSKYDEVNDQYIDTKQVWDETRQRSLNSFIEGTLGNDREMYKWYYYATGKEKFEGFTTIDKKLIRDKIQTSVVGAYNTEESKKVAPMTAKQKMQENARNRHNARAKFKGNEGMDYATGDIIMDNGKNAKTFATGKGFKMSEVFLNSFDDAKKIDNTYNAAIVDEDGNVFLSNGKDNVSLDKTQQVYIARQLGLSTDKELFKLAGAKNKNNSKSDPLGLGI